MSKIISVLATLQVFFALSPSAFAADFSLEDKNILGRYVLNPVNRLSSIQTAEIRYDADQELYLFISHTGGNYSLKTIGADGVIVGGAPDASCEDCESEGEATDDPTKIRLVKGNSGRPRLIIDVTWGDTLDADGKNGQTVTYVLDWATTIPNAISFYQNVENPAALKAAIDACTAVVTPALSDDGPISSESEVCPDVSTVKYRTTVEESVPWYLKENAALKGTHEISVAEASAARLKEEKYFANLPAKGLKVKPAVIASAFRKVSDYLAKNTDRVYVRELDGNINYYMINSRERLLFSFSLSAR